MDEDKWQRWLDGPAQAGVPWAEFEKGEAPRFDLKKSGLREYSENDIRAIARETEMLVSKHLNVKSKWSGRIVVDYERDRWLKDPSCDIVTSCRTSPSIIMHEQIHARSSSRFATKVYIFNRGMEESSVQLLTQEICKIEGIPFLESGYDEGVDALRKINSDYKLFDSDYEFAVELMKIGLDTREARLTEMVLESFGEEFKIEENLMIYSDYQRLLGKVERSANRIKY